VTFSLILSSIRPIFKEETAEQRAKDCMEFECNQLWLVNDNISPHKLLYIESNTQMTQAYAFWLVQQISLTRRT
jgi:hypothetical protein